MKTRLFAILLVTAVLGFNACGGDETKSSECDMLSFTVGTQAYTPGNGTFTWNYPKSGEAAWPTEPNWPVEPTVVVSKNADYTPKGTQTFVNADGTAKSVIYTVKAQDGTEKKYTVSATKTMTL